MPQILRRTLLIASAILLCLLTTITASATYFEGDINTPRYSSTLPFNLEISGYTTQATPSISITDAIDPTENLEYTLADVYHSDGHVGVEMYDFWVSYDGIPENLTTAYSVTFNFEEAPETVNTNYLTFKITSVGGVYDLDKMAIPYLYIPSGYSASIRIQYHVRFTQEQSDGAIGHSYDIRYQLTADDFRDVPLLSEDYAGDTIEGAFIVDSYTATISLDYADPLGEAGVYSWNTVLRYPDDEFLGKIMSAENGLFMVDTDQPVYISNLDNEMLPFYGFTLAYSSGDLELNYEDIESRLVYTYDDDTWHMFEGSNQEEYTSSEVRRMLIQSSWVETFSYSSALTPDEIDFINYVLHNTTYYSSEDPSSDYLDLSLEYNVTRDDSTIVSDIYGLYYDLGVSNGTNGEFDVDAGGWIANAIGGFFAFELMPGFTLGSVFAVIISVFLATCFLKIFAGG